MSAERSTTGAELVLRGVEKNYATRRFRGARSARVLDDVSFTLGPGESLGLVGQSGSGKTTLARLVTGIERPTAGTIEFDGIRVDLLRARELRRYRSRVQMIFQDPYAALNPVHRVGYALRRPLANYLNISGREADGEVSRLLDIVGLTPVEQFETKFPHELSGGQLQRVVIARSLASRPQVIVADEPVSMLDVSLRVGILRLLDELRSEMGMALLYITHDLLSARIATERLVVLHEGRVVERGRTIDVLRHPQHEYTRRLLAAVPNPFRKLAA